ncbi:MAG: histone deacetylase family protein [Caldilineaceae bacterium]|nr:histone deacetylase family protein [Caldilineaceae bacterium]
MKVFFTKRHQEHRPRHEFTGGALIPAFDSPERADLIAEALQQAGGFQLTEPKDHGSEPILAVHDKDYVAFLQTAMDVWKTAGMIGSPMASNVAGRPKGVEPESIEGRVGYFANACDTTIDRGTWQAAYASAQVAVSAAQYVGSGKANTAFALCRPPGHHCEADRFGGYCYLNNAAIAAQSLRDMGLSRVGILDLDFHHGNGTQEIFWARNDVWYGSVHGDPRHCYPFFAGHADERGGGEGVGSTLNLPLPPGSNNDAWLSAVAQLIWSLGDFEAEAVVVSLGVDPHHDDPQSFFDVTERGFGRAANFLRDAGIPSVVVMEGGYCADALAPSVLAFLDGLAPRSDKQGEPT